MEENSHPTSGLFRRIGAMLYDALLLTAVLMLVTAISLIFTGGKAIPSDNYYYRLIVYSTVFIFYAGFWLKSGQTLGMLAWRLKLVTLNSEPVTGMHVVMRFLCAIPSLGCAGLGLLWMFLNKERLAWHDSWSETKLIVLPGKPKKES